MYVRALRLIAVVLAGFVGTPAHATMQAPSTCPGREPIVHAIVLDPTTPSTIYVGADDGLALSDDGGRTWTHRPFSPGGEQIWALAVDARDRATLWAGTGQDLRRTRDRGVTWTTMAMPPYRIPLGMRIIAKVIGFYSDEVGEAAAAASEGKYPIHSIIVVPGVEPAVLVGAVGVLRSTDDGTTWHRMPIVKSNHQTDENASIQRLVPDPHTAGTSWAVSGTGILVSHDRGATWRRLEGAPYVTSLVADPRAADTLYAGTVRTGIIRSVDAGGSWTPIGGDLATAYIRLVTVGLPDTLYATVQDRGLFMSTDGGWSWIQSLPVTSDTTLDITSDPSDPATMYAIGIGRGLWKTTDAGSHWFRMCGLSD